MEEEQEELIQEHIKIRKLFNNIIYYYNDDLDNKNFCRENITF
jgi:hypothetical protein